MYIFLTNPINCVYNIDGKKYDTVKICALYCDEHGGKEPRLFKIARDAAPLFAGVSGLETQRIYFDEHGRAVGWQE